MKDEMRLDFILLNKGSEREKAGRPKEEFKYIWVTYLMDMKAA